MKKYKNSILKWIVVAITIILLIFTLDMIVLANPYPLFPYQTQFNNLTFHSDEPFNENLLDEIKQVNQQIINLEIYDPSHEMDLFLCQRQKTYNLLARLSFVQTNIPGFNLSVFNNSFISVERIKEIRQIGQGTPAYSVFSGELSHCITHEIIHDYHSERINILNYSNAARWKREGYAEFNASRLKVIADTAESLQDRIFQIKNNPYWTDHIREYYSWRTAIEYLSEIKSYSFDDIMHDSVTFEATNRSMAEWYKNNL